FFLVLFFAALTSAVSMLEVSVAAVRETLGWSRRRTAFLLTGGILLAGMPSALSYSAVGFSVGGVRVLDFLDETVGSIGLPIAALLTSVTFTWFLHRSVLESQIDGTQGPARIVLPLCKYVIPAVLITTTAARLLSGVDIPATRLIPGTEFIGSLAQGAGILVILALLLGIIALFCRLRHCRIPLWLMGWR
ncbi:MAG: sodium-dependent transporter, partial [Methanomicrobiales archaeon]|nr:sodium-dependent transporter [Methanomicrobiales archaeon]